MEDHAKWKIERVISELKSLEDKAERASEESMEA